MAEEGSAENIRLAGPYYYLLQLKHNRERQHKIKKMMGDNPFPFRRKKERTLERGRGTTTLYGRLSVWGGRNIVKKKRKKGWYLNLKSRCKKMKKEKEHQKSGGGKRKGGGVSQYGLYRPAGKMGN